MRTVSEAAREIPVIAETEILVVGSGPAGLAAGLSAAREGVETMLVERFGCFGGAITQVGVGSMSWYRSAGTIDAECIGIEFETQALKMGAARVFQGDPKKHGVGLDTEMFKVVADTMVQAANIRPLLHAQAVETVMEGNAIRGSSWKANREDRRSWPTAWLTQAGMRTSQLLPVRLLRNCQKTS